MTRRGTRRRLPPLRLGAAQPDPVPHTTHRFALTDPYARHCTPHLDATGLCVCGCDDCTGRLTGACWCDDCRCLLDDDHRVAITGRFLGQTPIQDEIRDEGPYLPPADTETEDGQGGDATT